MLPNIEPFYIVIYFDRNKRRLKVEQTAISLFQEEFTVYAGNGTLVYVSNRPKFRKQGIKKRRPILRLISGHLKYSNIETDIAEKIIDHVMKLEIN